MAPRVTLTFDECTYAVKTSFDGKPAKPWTRKTKDKALVQRLTGTVQSGSVLAILGPSGAGKTTLLNMLTLQKLGGKPSGHIYLNGHRFTLSMYSQHCAYVQQQDSLWASLTVLDHLQYAYECFQPNLSATERAAAIDDMLKTVGLYDARHVKAGNQFTRGLSGGMKRRLSIAVALAKQPSVVYLDEPTTGIDSASASSIMEFLKTIAELKEIAIVCTIHQPPASVFAGFDKNLILASGRIAYSGEAKKMGAYFESELGKPPPPNCNVAEFVLDLVNKDFTSQGSVDHILEHWQASRGGTSNPPTVSEIGSPPRRASFLNQILICTRRQFKLAVREPLLYTGRMAACLSVMLFFGIVYISTRQRDQDQQLMRLYYMIFVVGIPAQFMMVNVFASYYASLSVKREVRDGMYNPISATIASWIVELPMLFLISACVLIPTYIMGDLHWPSFPLVWLIYSTMQWSFEGMAQCFGLAPSPLLGLFNFLNIYFAAFLFMGMFVDPNDVVVFLRWLCYVLPLRYSMRSIVHALLINDRDHNGVEDCTAGQLIDGTNITCSTRGFYCPDDPNGFVCYGKKGSDILDSFSPVFSIYSSKVDYAFDIGIIISVGLVFRLGYLIQLLMQCKSAAIPSEPDAVPVSGTTSNNAPPSVLELPASASAGRQLPEAAVFPAPVATGPLVSFDFSGITSTLPPKLGCMGKGARPEKVLISDISGKVEGGQVMAIAGPSGCGKTTLLNSLTLVPGPGITTGKLTLDGQPLTPSIYQEHCVYVPREDTLWATFTARQHVELAFSLYQPHLSSTEKSKAVDELLASTGMESCADTKAGDAFRPGLSGGQRRRLSLALALIKNPRVIILDEPTSGLDSAAAAAIVKLLKYNASKTGASIICTIHQPSAAVFATFDSIIILAEGRTAYAGETSKMNAYLSTTGHPPPSDANPAEFVLDIVTQDKDAVQNAKETTLLDEWQKRASAPASPQSTGRLGKATPKASLGAQIVLISARSMRLAISDPILYLVRAVVSAFMVSFFGLVYKESANQVQEQATPRLFYLWWLVCVPPCLNIVTVYVLNVESTITMAEIRNGLYSPIAYIIGTTLVQLPMMLLIGAACTIPAFGIGGFPWDNYVSTWITMSLALWSFECVAQSVALLKNPIVGIVVFVQLWVTSVLNTGLVFRGTDVIWPIRLFYYIFPLKWAFNCIAFNVFSPAGYDGAEECEPGDTVLNGQYCREQGFFCPEIKETLQCFGKTGIQVLDTLHYSYDTVDKEDNRLIDIVIVIAIGVYFKMIYVALFWKQTSAIDKGTYSSKQLAGNTVSTTKQEL